MDSFFVKGEERRALIRDFARSSTEQRGEKTDGRIGNRWGWTRRLGTIEPLLQIGRALCGLEKKCQKEDQSAENEQLPSGEVANGRTSKV